MSETLANNNTLRIVNKIRFNELCNKGEITHKGCKFLDGFKIALHTNKTVLKSPHFIDSHKFVESDWKPVNLSETILIRNNFYLGVSDEKICISNRLMGMLHTRSYWARMGLDCIGSSYYVSPGFGGNKPTPIILEIQTKVNIKLDFENAVACLILYEFENPVQNEISNHDKRFPLNLKIYTDEN